MYFGNICSAMQKGRRILFTESQGVGYSREILEKHRTMLMYFVHVLTLFHLIFFVESEDCG